MASDFREAPHFFVPVERIHPESFDRPGNVHSAAGWDTVLKPIVARYQGKVLVVSHGRYVAFQMAEVAVSRHLLGDILRLIAELRPQPDPAPA